jgi:hypothetical protein
MVLVESLAAGVSDNESINGQGLSLHSARLSVLDIGPSLHGEADIANNVRDVGIGF